MDLFLNAYVVLAPIPGFLLVLWRIAHEAKYERPGSRSAFILGGLLLPACPSCLLVALERTDFVDYPDGGQSGLWALAGFGCLILSPTLLAIGTRPGAKRAETGDEVDASPRSIMTWIKRIDVGWLLTILVALALIVWLTVF